jgi:RNA polymerase sigma-70 factor, ECF subfamily
VGIKAGDSLDAPRSRRGGSGRTRSKENRCEPCQCLVMALKPQRAMALADVEAIYRARRLEFRRVAAAIGGDRDAAPDLVQEAFVRAVRELESFRGGGALEGWLWRIVVNVARNHRRDARQIAELPAELPASANGHGQPDERVRAAVSLLPERQRIVLFLRYYADLDYAAIAQATEMAPGTVGATLNAARSALEQLLSSEANK